MDDEKFNPFDPASLRLDLNFSDGAGVKKARPKKSRIELLLEERRGAIHREHAPTGDSLVSTTSSSIAPLPNSIFPSRRCSMSSPRNEVKGGVMLEALPFGEIWAVDFEFAVAPGERPKPVCLVAWELRSKRKLRLWRNEFGSSPPYGVGPNSLFIAYYASAEIGCHLALGWPKPARILDLFAEFRCRTNGLQTPAGDSLLGALACYGIDGMASAEKEAMRDLVLRGGPWSAEEQKSILDYCEQDVAALAKLLTPMLRHIDLPRALLRGRYMAAAANIEHTGIPIDVPLLCRLREHWAGIQDQLIAEI